MNVVLFITKTVDPEDPGEPSVVYNLAEYKKIQTNKKEEKKMYKLSLFVWVFNSV